MANGQLKSGVEWGGVVIQKYRISFFAILAVSLGACLTAGAAAISARAESGAHAPSAHHRLDDGLSARLKGYLLQVHQSNINAYRLAAGADNSLLTPQPEPTTRAPASSDGNDLLNNNAQPNANGNDLLNNSNQSQSNSNDLLNNNNQSQSNSNDLLNNSAQPNANGNDLLNNSAQPNGNDLLKAGEDNSNETTASRKKEDLTAAKLKAANAEHEKLFLESKYPSASTCGTCHVTEYKQWSVSQHSYAQLSPIYMAMQTAINLKTSSTDGDFCIRCHDSVGMNLGDSIYISNLKRSPTSREGITCVVCHRINKNYGKVSGRFSVQRGSIYAPVYGPTGDKGLKQVLSQPGKYSVSTSKDQPGRSIHAKVVKFFALTKPSFCGMCHDVTEFNGFRLEEAFSEFKQSGAARRGITCEDCHMGKVQGRPAGYDYGPAAIIGGTPTRTRKLTNHFFGGPDYSIIHPGIFPHNVKAEQFKTLKQWLQFNYRAGWGTDKFENNLPKDYKFPKAWQSIDDRYEARDILNEQFKLLAQARRWRRQVLRNGFKVSGIKLIRSDRGGLKFSVTVSNPMDGDPVPTGFDAERLFFIKVTVKDRHGHVVFASGDRDPNGDLRDSHSLYVHNGAVPRDEQLFSLQSRFLVRLLRGGERSQVLPINSSADVLPFVRPDTRATVIYGRPRGVRKQKRGIEPGGHRTANYEVPGNRLRAGERYSISAEFISQELPVNLIAAIQVAGFDYSMSPAQVARAMVRGSMVLYSRHLNVTIR